MAQKRKKPSVHQKQKLAKIHHKKGFLQKLRYVINSCSTEDIFSLIAGLRITLTQINNISKE